MAWSCTRTKGHYRSQGKSDLLSFPWERALPPYSEQVAGHRLRGRGAIGLAKLLEQIAFDDGAERGERHVLHAILEWPLHCRARLLDQAEDRTHQPTQRYRQPGVW